MYLLVIFIISFILLLIESEYDITNRIYKKLESYLGHAALLRSLALIIIAYQILVVIGVLVIKFLFEYNGLANGYLHYIFLIFVGLIGMIPIYLFFLNKKTEKENSFYFLNASFFLLWLPFLMNSLFTLLKTEIFNTAFKDFF
jgi:hypothetical protein